MPSWIMHALIRTFGASVALPLVATQTGIVVALAPTWRLGWLLQLIEFTQTKRFCAPRFSAPRWRPRLDHRKRGFSR
jgi:hypothetical protein